MAELEKIKVDELKAARVRIDLVRTIYRSLVDCHSHLWELVLLCRDANDMQNAVHFSNLIFRKDAKNVSLGGGKFERYGGKQPFLTDTAYLFFRYGRWLAGYKDNKENRVVFDDHLYRHHEATIKAAGVGDTMFYHLSSVADAAFSAQDNYNTFHNLGFSFIYESGNSPSRLAADKGHYDKRTGMLERLVAKCVRMIEALSPDQTS